MAPWFSFNKEVVKPETRSNQFGRGRRPLEPAGIVYPCLRDHPDKERRWNEHTNLALNEQPLARFTSAGNGGCLSLLHTRGPRVSSGEI